MEDAGILLHDLFCNFPCDRQHDHLEAGGGGEVDNGGSRHGAAPEEGVDLAVLQSRHGRARPELFPLEILVPVDSDCLEDVIGLLLGAAVRGARGDALALEVHDRFDPASLLCHKVERLLVEAENHADLMFSGKARHLPVVCPSDVIVVSKGQTRLPGRQQLQVVDCGRCRFGGGLGVWDILADNPPDGAAQRIPDAAGAAGHDAEREFVRFSLGADAAGKCQRYRQDDRQSCHGSIFANFHCTPPYMMVSTGRHCPEPLDAPAKNPTGSNRSSKSYGCPMPLGDPLATGFWLVHRW